MEIQIPKISKFPKFPKFSKARPVDQCICVFVIASVLFGAYAALTSTAPPARKCAYEPAQRCAEAISAYRAARRLPPVKFDRELSRGANETATENARANRLKHAPNCGAEIIAYNYEGFEAAVDQWDASPGHRRILAGRQYKKVGCAMVRRGDRFYCCARFK